MTCIVGVIDKETKSVLLGGDTAVSSDDNIWSIKHPKVFIYNNSELAIGVSGSTRLINLLMHSHQPPPINGDDLFDYFINQFTPSLKGLLKVNGLGKLPELDDHNHESTALIGVRGRLFTLEADFSILECDSEYAAIGSGSEVALGSLYSTSHITNLQERLAIALSASEKYKTTVLKPFNFIEIKYNNRV